MSTRSFISYTEGSSIRTVYCHWDGYPAYNGKILKTHYSDIDKLKQLLDGGDMSSLQANIADINYYKDRGDTGTEATWHHSMNTWMRFWKESWCDYAYAFKDGEWFYITDGMHKFVPLTDEVIEAD